MTYSVHNNKRPGPWHEIRTAVGRDEAAGKTIYEVRRERRLPGGYYEQQKTVIRYEEE
jgi:hypothetical protein